MVRRALVEQRQRARVHGEHGLLVPRQLGHALQQVTHPLLVHRLRRTKVRVLVEPLAVHRATCVTYVVRAVLAKDHCTRCCQLLLNLHVAAIRARGHDGRGVGTAFLAVRVGATHAPQHRPRTIRQRVHVVERGHATQRGLGHVGRVNRVSKQRVGTRHHVAHHVKQLARHAMRVACSDHMARGRELDQRQVLRQTRIVRV